MDWTIVLSTIIAGLIYALSGYFKSTDEAWDSVKFIRTVIIGVIVGIAMLVLDMDVSEAHAFIIGLGIVPLIDNAIKAILREYRRIVNG
jgi:hypothetical protein